MSAHREIFRTTFIQYFIYRLNFVLWRARMVLSLLIIYFLWQAVFENRSTLFGYTQPQMLTYILLSTLVSNFVLTTKTADIAGEIVAGNIINYVLKPISFFSYQMTRDVADKLVNISFAVVELLLVIAIFKPTLVIQHNMSTYFFFLLLLCSGIAISFFVNLTLSFIGFWTVEVWAPRFIFFIIIFFLSGTYFPLDILPKPIYFALLVTPFPYFYYLPTKVYLTPHSPLLPFFVGMSLFWTVATYLLARWVWNAGLKNYSFFGR